MATIYQPLSADVELRLDMEIRFYNGIDSDPRVILREPTLTEILAAAARLRPGGNMSWSEKPTIDYPEQDSRHKTRLDRHNSQPT